MTGHPKISKIIDILGGLSFVNRAARMIDDNVASINIKTLHGSLKSLAVAALCAKISRPVFIIASDNTEAERWLQDLEIFIEPERLASLVEPQKQMRLKMEHLDEPLIWLTEGLSTLNSSFNPVAVATSQVFSLDMPNPELLNKFRLKLNAGQKLNREEFITHLALNGFEKKEFVSTYGDMAVRGGIVDLYPVSFDNPIRIEFWGNEIESLRQFSPQSQRSICTLETVEFMSNVFHPSQIENTTHISKYISPDTVFVIDCTLLADISSILDLLPEKHQVLYINKLTSGTHPITLGNEINEKNEKERESGSILAESYQINKYETIEVNSQPQATFTGFVQSFGKELKRLYDEQFKIVLAAEGNIHLQRLYEIIENSLEVENNSVDGESINPLNEKILDSIIWLDKSPAEGFSLPEQRLVCYTEHGIFGRQRVHSSRRQKTRSGGLTLRELKQLNIGDYVVHEDKGIGKFTGFENIRIGSSLQECVKLLYAENDVLYVHLNHINKIQKFSAEEGAVPKMSRLGSTEWARKKSRTKSRLKDIARKLIILYAERKKRQGFSYPGDTIWQKELEASFMYEDTPDQATTTSEVKKDMESETPMDRLVCGDVGFGKTEIAIRAAFKAVQAGKQVAVLVPTTILADQHYMTFNDRMDRYPVMIDMISRFRSKKEQTEIIKKVSEGKIDILVGTHRILSKDIHFKDLGLLVVDEEHRFGVEAKEKLRQMQVEVDTLTLTATPIPRTLNFSLMGARDLSVIETPPRNRVPVQTEILEWDNDFIVSAIANELSRGGQVYFVTDKVLDIDKIAMDLKMLMPTFRFAVAHGQMKSSELESVMEKFIQKKLDVLICTKIIESGLDIPNANTIFINRPQNFGLAELYQLRGRVGRSNIQAFCYLLVPSFKTITGNTLRRLQVIEEFTELGSGFQLAMRDMEIRGAGNLLGAEQSGFINDIGFDLYHKILDEAVFELKTEEFSELFQTDKKLSRPTPKNEDLTIEIDDDAFLPSEYISNETERFYFYKKLYHASSNQEADDIAREITDRYGKLPKQAEGLLLAVRLRISALPTGFTKIIFKHNKLIAEFPELESDKNFAENIFPALMEFVQEQPGARVFEKKKKLYFEIKLGSTSECYELLYKIRKLIENLGD